MRLKLKKNFGMIIYFSILLITFILMIGGYIFKYNRPITTPGTTFGENIGSINEDCTIVQRFIVRAEQINSIDFRYVDLKPDVKEGKMLVEVYDNNEEILFRKLYNLKDLAEIHEINAVFLPVKDAVGDMFELRITFKGLKDGKAVTFYSVNANTFPEETYYDIETYNENLVLNGSIDFVQHGIEKGYLYMFVLYVIFLIEILFGSFKYIKMKELNKKKMVIGSIINVIIACTMAISLMTTYYNIVFLDKIGFFSFPILLVTSSIEMVIIGTTIANNKEKVSRIFLALAIPLGALYLVCMVPGSVPDETFHSVMTYELATGQISQKDVTYVKELETRFNKIGDIAKSLTDKTETKAKYSRTTRYWLVMYIPGAIGMALGKLCGLSVLGYMYVGCFVNYLLFLLVGYLIIEKLPFGKYAALVYMLSPMYLQQATSLSADASINALTLLFTALIMNFKFKKEKLKTSEMIIILLLSGFVAYCKKMAYLPMLLLLFLIKDKLKEYIKNHKLLTTIVLVCIISFLVASQISIFSAYQHSVQNVEQTIVQNDEQNDNKLISEKKELNASPVEITKMQYLTANPVENVPYLVLETLRIYTNNYIFQFPGHLLNWLSVGGPAYLIIIFYIILFASALLENSNKKFSRIDKLLIVLFWLINFCFICGGLYIGFGATNILSVGGVQGRYFIPITLVLLLLLSASKIKLNLKNKNLFVTIPLLFINIYMIILAMQYYL